jgi:hypothetical protein
MATEKESLVKEYNEYLVDKKVGTRMMTQGKISDVTQTLKAVEEEVYCESDDNAMLMFIKLLNLKSHTGIETLLYATRGSTDLPLRGVAFETEGVKDFMGTVVGMDTLDFVSKMEGFAVQGVRGE